MKKDARRRFEQEWLHEDGEMIFGGLEANGRKFKSSKAANIDERSNKWEDGCNASNTYVDLLPWSSTSSCLVWFGFATE